VTFPGVWTLPHFRRIYYPPYVTSFLAFWWRDMNVQTYLVFSAPTSRPTSLASLVVLNGSKPWIPKSNPASWVRGKGKVIPMFTKHHAMKTYWGSGAIAPRLHDLGTRWRGVVSFTPRPLYPQGKSPRNPLDRRLGGPLEKVVKRKVCSPCLESNSARPARSLVSKSTELSLLLLLHEWIF
jgi:hypothetical protein